MRNELLLIASILVIYFGVLLMFRLFGEHGLYAWTAIATIAANIEVLIVIKAFGMEMTLGNVLFASTFLVTDIISELFGKKEAKRAVYIGIATSVSFIVLSQMWLCYLPAESDWAMPSMQSIFSNTPRLMIAGVAVYVVVQLLDVWLYHKWWAFTNRRFGDTKRFLWLRNNGSTLVSQALNAILYTWAAFFGVYETKTLVSIAAASYIIFIVTSLADTPFVYLARKMHETKGIRPEHFFPYHPKFPDLSKD